MPTRPQIQLLLGWADVNREQRQPPAGAPHDAGKKKSATPESVAQSPAWEEHRLNRISRFLRDAERRGPETGRPGRLPGLLGSWRPDIDLAVRLDGGDAVDLGYLFGDRRVAAPGDDADGIHRFLDVKTGSEEILLHILQ
jgi:hypothetical protein